VPIEAFGGRIFIDHAEFVAGKDEEEAKSSTEHERKL